MWIIIHNIIPTMILHSFPMVLCNICEDIGLDVFVCIFPVDCIMKSCVDAVYYYLSILLLFFICQLLNIVCVYVNFLRL